MAIPVYNIGTPSVYQVDTVTRAFTGVKNVDSGRLDIIIENKQVIFLFELAWWLH